MSDIASPSIFKQSSPQLPVSWYCDPAVFEAEQRLLAEQLSGGAIYAGDATRLAEVQGRFAQIEDDLMAALERWEALTAG